MSDGGMRFVGRGTMKPQFIGAGSDGMFQNPP